MPKVYKQLERVRQLLEKHYRDMQDMEFTVEEGKLYMLQTRTGKRTPTATFRIAVDMVQEGLIKREEAIERIRSGGYRAAVLSGDRLLRAPARSRASAKSADGHQRRSRRRRRQSRLPGA